MVKKEQNRIWEATEPGPNGRSWTCKACGETFSGALQRCAAHIARNPNFQIKVCSGPINAEYFNLSNAHLQATAKRKRNLKDDFNCHNSSSEGKNCRPKMASISDEDLQVSVERAGEALVKAISDEDLPIGVLHSQSFQSFVSAIIKAGPAFSLPSDAKLRQLFVGKMEKLSRKIKAQCESDEVSAFGSTLQIGSGGKNMPRMLILSNIKADWMFKLINPSKNNLTDSINEMVDPSKHSRIDMLIFDDFAENENAIEIKSSFPWLSATPCACRVLSNILDDIDAEINFAHSVISDSCKIIKYLHQIEVREGGNRKWVLSSESRYAGKYFSVLQISESRKSVADAVSSKEAFDENELNFKALLQRVKQDLFWKQVDRYLAITTPIIELIRVLSEEKIFSHKILQAFVGLHQTVLSKEIPSSHYFEPIDSTFHILKSIFKRGACKIFHPLYAAAYILDPSNLIKNCPKKSFNAMEKVFGISLQDQIKIFVSQHVTTEKRAPAFQQLREYLEKINGLTLNDDFSPLKWWQTFPLSRDKWCFLRPIALSVLSKGCAATAAVKCSEAAIMMGGASPVDLETRLYVKYNERISEGRKVKNDNFSDREVEKYMLKEGAGSLRFEPIDNSDNLTVSGSGSNSWEFNESFLTADNFEISGNVTYTPFLNEVHESV